MRQTTDVWWSLFSMISQTFGLGQTNWAHKSCGIWGIFNRTIGTILALWVPCPRKWIWSFFLQKLRFSGLTHIYPKYHRLGNSHHTLVIGGRWDAEKIIIFERVDQKINFCLGYLNMKHIGIELWKNWWRHLWTPPTYLRIWICSTFGF